MALPARVSARPSVPCRVRRVVAVARPNVPDYRDQSGESDGWSANGEETSVRARWGTAGLIVVVGAGIALAGCTGSADHGRTATAVEVSRGTCGKGWTDPHGGEQTFRVHNVGIKTAEVQLIAPATGAVYAEIEGLAPGTSRPMQLNLARGRYAFKCLPEDTDAFTGHTVSVTDGPRRGAPAVRPVDKHQLYRPTQTFRRYVSSSFPGLRRDVSTLEAAVRSGDRAAARRAWLPAHLDYERLGAAYDTFGDAADAVDGLPAGLPKGVHDTGFTGFHRIEYGLWHRESMSSLTSPAHRLVVDVRKLIADFDRTQTDPNDLPLRAHEILEGTLEFQLTGHAGQGSGSCLATARANVDGTRAVLHALHPVLVSRYRKLPTAEKWLTRTAKLLDAQHHNGRWTPVGSLSRSAHQHLDAVLGRTLELLAPIAALAQVRRSR